MSEELVNRLRLATTDCPESTFKSANGGLMICSAQVPELVWYAQGQTFSSTAKVLPLRCFDMIIGEDWPEEVSPMWVDWRTKKMKFTYKEQRVTLAGVMDDIDQCFQVSYKKLKGLIKHGAVTHCIQLNSVQDPETNTVKNPWSMAFNQ